MLYSRHKSVAGMLRLLARTAAVAIFASTLIGVGLLLAATRPLEAAFTRLAQTLETRFQRVAIADHIHVTGIVMLGGGPDRAREALRLARLHPHARVILSGPGSDEVAILAGAPDLEARLTIDHRARNTFENAVFSHALAAPKDNEHWLLVTSALHMSRSMGVFRAVGFNIAAWPVRDTPKLAAHAAHQARHEVLGLVYYRLLGRTALLLPS